MTSKIVGVVANSLDFNHPCDRRRYLPFFKRAGIAFEHASFYKHYEVLYVSLAADLNMWSRYKAFHGNKKIKIIFDLTDNYLSADGAASFLRAVGHYLLGRTKTLSFDYRQTIIEFLHVVDVVTVGSLEQKNFVKKFHRNVVVVRDFFFDDFNQELSENFDGDEQSLSFCWEGFSHGSFRIFKFLSNILRQYETTSDRKVSLFLITDPIHCRFFGRLCCLPTRWLVKLYFYRTNVEVRFLEWSLNNLNFALSKTDLALIPMFGDKGFQSKPENKLLLFWNCGIPVISGISPSYERVMMESGNGEFLCSENIDWIENIEKLLHENTREKYIDNANAYIKKYATEEQILITWDYIFATRK